MHSSVDPLDLAGMLSYLSPDCCRDEWWRILAGVKAEFGDRGYSDCLTWSAQSPKFKQQEFDSTWRSLTGSGITIATVVQAAKDAGWRPASTIQAKARPPKPIKSPPPKPTNNRNRALARAIWLGANKDSGAIAGHPYAVAKNLTHNFGAARATCWFGNDANTDCIVVPKRQLEWREEPCVGRVSTGNVVGIERIAYPGAGGKKSLGNFGVLVLGNELDPTLTVTLLEGWASAIAMFKCQPNGCYVAVFSKSNFDKVAAFYAAAGRNVFILEDGE